MKKHISPAQQTFVHVVAHRIIYHLHVCLLTRFKKADYPPSSTQLPEKATSSSIMSVPHLTGKVAIVTGGSKGIGAATCIALAQAGAAVVLNYSSDETAAKQVIEKIGGDRALAIKGDASSIPFLEDLVKQTVDKFGKIDIVIPCAGILPMNNLESTSEAIFDYCFALNVKGPYFLVQKAVPHMSAGSRVILLSTTLNVASTVTPNYLLYNASKGAIDQMARVMSKDLAAKGIMVNAVAPGPTATELFLKGKPGPLLKTIASGNPQGRLGEPEDIADVMVFLCGPGSRWLTGQRIPVNGGMA